MKTETAVPTAVVEIIIQRTVAAILDAPHRVPKIEDEIVRVIVGYTYEYPGESLMTACIRTNVMGIVEEKVAAKKGRVP